MARKNPLKFHHTQALSGQPAFKAIPPARSFFLFGISILIMIFIGSAIFYINTHVKVYDYGYQINQAIERKRALIEENKRLRLEIAQLKNPKRLEDQVAANLEIAKASQLVYLKDLKQSQFYQLAKQQGKPEVVPQVEIKKESKKVAKVLAENKKTSAKKPVAKKNLPKKNSELAKSQSSSKGHAKNKKTPQEPALAKHAMQDSSKILAKGTHNSKMVKASLDPLP